MRVGASNSCATVPRRDRRIVGAAAQGESAKPGSAALANPEWGAKFDRIIEDPDIDWSGIPPTGIGIIRASIAGGTQTLFASTDEYGICLCSPDDAVADTLENADFSLLMALRELAEERGGERPLFGRRIIIPANPGSGGIGRGVQR